MDCFQYKSGDLCSVAHFTILMLGVVLGEIHNLPYLTQYFDLQSLSIYIHEILYTIFTEINLSLHYLSNII